VTASAHRMLAGSYAMAGTHPTPRQRTPATAEGPARRSHDAETRAAVAWAVAQLRHREPLREAPGWDLSAPERTSQPPAWHAIVFAAVLAAVVLGFTAWLDARAAQPAVARQDPVSSVAVVAALER
jgi:hypothetical protein